jgi:hypothetical protein
MSDEIGKVQFDPRRSGDLMLDMHLQELLGMQQEMLTEYIHHNSLYMNDMSAMSVRIQKHNNNMIKRLTDMVSKLATLCQNYRNHMYKRGALPSSSGSHMQRCAHQYTANTSEKRTVSETPIVAAPKTRCRCFG